MKGSMRFGPFQARLAALPKFASSPFQPVHTSTSALTVTSFPTGSWQGASWIITAGNTAFVLRRRPQSFHN